MTNIKDYKLTTQLKVEFITKELFILMNEQMNKNILDKDNLQNFFDTTYNIFHPQKSHMKLF